MTWIAPMTTFVRSGTVSIDFTSSPTAFEIACTEASSVSAVWKNSA
jgi:hypothetical protein